MHEFFRHYSERTAHAVGSHWAFLIALLVVIAWLITGPIYNYSDTWQLLINTGTTIITFLMVFLIQNAQNRGARIVSLKLDELLRSSKEARTGLVKLDGMTDEELDHVAAEFEKLQQKYAPLIDDDLAMVHEERSKRHRKRHHR